MAITRNNFSGTLTANEFEGVDISLLTVSAGADISAEIGDPNANSAVAGLEMIKQAIQNQGVNILGNGTLQGTQNFTVMVRSDSLDTISSTTTVAAIQAAIIALDDQRTGSVLPRATADLSGATVAVRQLYSTTA
jgi:hypothetical protein